MKPLVTIAFLWWMLPTSATAAVIISEIAWMGSDVSANDEWIELFNSGPEPVDVTGWTISDGENLEILLAGAVGAGEYAVLERTNDDSAPGEAFLIYTGALKNSGATLTLRDVFGASVDVVSGGADWALIGGDNSSKYTAQRTAAGWVTAPASPGSGQLVAAPTEAAEPTTPAAAETPTASAFSFATPTEHNEKSDEATQTKASNETPVAAAPAPQRAAATLPLEHSSWPYAGLVVLLSVGLIGLWVGGKNE